MGGRALVVLCFLLAGLRAQSGPTLPVSLPAKATSLAALGTSSASSPAVPTMSLASSTQDALGLPVTTAATLTLLPKNTSSEPTQEAIVSPDPSQQHTDPDTSLPGFSSTAGGVSSALTPEEHSLGGPGASMPATGWQSPTPLSQQDVASSPSNLSTAPLPAPSAPAPSNHSSQVPSTQPPRAPTAPAEEPSFGHTATTHATVEPGPKENTAQDAQPGKAICGPETTTPFLIMQEVGHALSSGSVAAITVTVIAMVVLVFGVAAYLKIRHSSYGRLLDDHDYGSWGNYNNPLYDDS
ncbi:prostate androgen-regulated mucin-like protein 1 [Heterocephalus glaber]|uniref:Prostate androgen-regulated mucin-like protein 1 n=1 Tax=Heterocephalus glaber TaxID=10181 RepID=A0AAX6SMR6_HETGA|nr:prostate androgen-regulated mucin-like protein 1 [Heterocephalus glaber]